MERCAASAWEWRCRDPAFTSVDVGSATIKVNDDGFYTLSIGAADMGTGCDTILAQIAAEVLECSVDEITVFGADTDTSPYDSGSYASSTTYITGKATVEKCALQVREQICKLGATDELPGNEVVFDGKSTEIQKESQAKCSGQDEETDIKTGAELAAKKRCGREIAAATIGNFAGFPLQISPPPPCAETGSLSRRP